MANENLLLCDSFTVSGNNLSASSDQFIFAKAGATSPEVVQACAGDPTLGITQETGKDAAAVNVGLAGISKLRLGGTVKHGNYIKSHTNGTGVLYTGVGHYGAKALRDGESGDVIDVLITTGFSSGS